MTIGVFKINFFPPIELPLNIEHRRCSFKYTVLQFRCGKDSIRQFVFLVASQFLVQAEAKLRYPNRWFLTIVFTHGRDIV